MMVSMPRSTCKEDAKWNAILGSCGGIRGAPFPIAFGSGSLEMRANIHTHGKPKGAACEEENEYSLWGSSPRPMAHKTIALTTELREPCCRGGSLLWKARKVTPT